MGKVSVVILNYNGLDFLQKFLKTTVKYSKPYEVFIIDNSSTDGSIAYIKEYFSEVNVIELRENLGYSEGYNEGLKKIDSNFYILLNSDVEVTKNWIPPMLDVFKSDEKIVALQPKILDYYHRDRFEYAGGGGGLIDVFGYPFCRGRIFETIEQDNGQYDDVKRIFWTTGACMMIKSKEFFEYGMFDGYFFAHMEEIDLCWRLNNAGLKLMYTGRSVVFHIGGGTLPKSNPRKTYLNFRNSLFMIYKNYSKTQFLMKFPIRILIDFLAIINYLYLFEIKNCFAVLKAYVSFFLNFHRYSHNDTSKKNDKELIYSKSIVFEYFLKKNKTIESLKFNNTK